jgi:hypothetical protein
MGTSERGRRDQAADGDAIDARIRYRFRACETMPLFPDPPRRPRGFFEAADIGPQLRFTLPCDPRVEPKR